MESPISTMLLNLLTEARRSDLPYTEKKTKNLVDKVIVNLSGNESGKFTKLSKQYKVLKDEIDKLSEKMVVLNAEIKEEAVDLFDATDEVYTRIVETASMTILIGKRQPDSIDKTVKIDYEKAIKEISLLVPGLTEQVQSIIKANTQIEEKLKVAKSPQLRVDIKEEFSISAIIKFVKSIGSKLRQSIRNWAKGYDKKLKEISQLIEKIQ